jgi:D-alanyl-D-alanine carboxypeptidase
MWNAAELSFVKALSLRRFALVLVFVSISALQARSAQASFASLLMDASTGQVLAATNADLPRYPASLTKMMTLYMVFEALSGGSLSLGQPLYTSTHASLQPPTKLGLRPGQSISVEDAILALVTKSANDAAAVVAEALGGSEDYFAWRMTLKARELGMNHTTFANASGLPDSRQVTTARDMGILALALLHDYPQYYQYFSTQRFYWGGSYHANHNRMLVAYPGVDGIKTGYTHASGFNLVASAERDGRRLIGVVMGARSPSNRTAIMTSLLDQAFLGGQIYIAQDEFDEPQTASRSAAAALAAIMPVRAAAAAETTPERLSRAGRVSSREAVRSKRGAVSSKVASRTRARAALAQRPAGRRSVVAGRAQAGRKAVQLTARQKDQARQGATTVRTKTPAKSKGLIAASQAKTPAARPGKTKASSTSKRRMASNKERGSRS